MTRLALKSFVASPSEDAVDDAFEELLLTCKGERITMGTTMCIYTLEAFSFPKERDTPSCKVRCLRKKKTVSALLIK